MINFKTHDLSRLSGKGMIIKLQRKFQVFSFGFLVAGCWFRVFITSNQKFQTFLSC